MGWTTIRVREETKQELKDKIDAKNMDKRVRYLLNNIDNYIEETVKQELNKISINRQGELEYR